MENNSSVENNSVKKRLIEFLKTKRISQTEFTRALGVSQTYIGAMRKSIPAEKVKRITELYPDLNRDWLLYGEGPMLVPEHGERQLMPEDEFETLLLPLTAFAGGLQMYSQGVGLADCTVIKSPVRGVDFAIPIKGDSMEPRFHEGSTLLIKRINDKAFIPWGHTMVIDTENGVLVKNIYPPKEEDSLAGVPYVIAKSFNPEYPPIEIPTSSIYGLYRILGTLDIFTNL